MFRKIKWFVKSVTLSKMKHMKCILWWRKEGDVREGNVNENGSLQIAPRPFKPPDAGPLSFSNSPIHEPGSSNIVQVICLQQEFFSSSANFVGQSQTCSGLPFITMCYLGHLAHSYLIFVIFCTRARFFKPKFYTQKRVN